MPALALSRLLGALTGEVPAAPYALPEFGQRVEAQLERCRGEGTQPWVFRYALKMLQHTYARLHEPAPAPPEESLILFKALVEPYPRARDDFWQGSVDPASSVRRAQTIDSHLQGSGPVLFLGDDDATSLALAMLPYMVSVVDIDERIIRWLRKGARRGRLRGDYRVHDLRTIPSTYHSKYAAVVTDPPADYTLAREFLLAARRCLQPGGWLFWCDHPDLNPAYDRLLAECDDLERVAVYENWHSYTAYVYSDATAEHFGIPPEWFYELASAIRIWSHLIVMRVGRV